MPEPSCQKSGKTIITQKGLVTQSSNIMHCDWHTQNLYVQIFKPFQTFFPIQIDIFSFFVRGSSVNSQKFHILLILTGKMHGNALSGVYFGFKACQIQWHRF